MIAHWLARHLTKRRLCRWCCGELITRNRLILCVECDGTR